MGWWSPARHGCTNRPSAGGERRWAECLYAKWPICAEHCSWVHQKGGQHHRESGRPGAPASGKVKANKPLDTIQVPMTRSALVIGGGIASIQAALDIADSGHKGHPGGALASAGGHMAQLSETFPTLDCSQCILTPRWWTSRAIPTSPLLTYSKWSMWTALSATSEVAIRKHARMIDEELCTGCGECLQKCPTKNVIDSFNEGLSMRRAIYVPFAQAVPNIRSSTPSIAGAIRRKSATAAPKPARPRRSSSTRRTRSLMSKSARSWWRPATK